VWKDSGFGRCLLRRVPHACGAGSQYDFGKLCSIQCFLHSGLLSTLLSDLHSALLRERLRGLQGELLSPNLVLFPIFEVTGLFRWLLSKLLS
jgi:hypothetical protein